MLLHTAVYLMSHVYKQSVETFALYQQGVEKLYGIVIVDVTCDMITLPLSNVNEGETPVGIWYYLGTHNRNDLSCFYNTSTCIYITA